MMYFYLIHRKQKYSSEKFEIQIIYLQVAIYQFCLNFMYYKTFTFVQLVSLYILCHKRTDIFYMCTYTM